MLTNSTPGTERHVAETGKPTQVVLRVVRFFLKCIPVDLPHAVLSVRAQRQNFADISVESGVTDDERLKYLDEGIRPCRQQQSMLCSHSQAILPRLYQARSTCSRSVAKREK